MANKEEYANQPALIIGLGGTGVKTCKRLKAHLMEKAPEVLDENGGSVFFYALDLEPYQKKDHLPLDPGEFQPLAINATLDDFVNGERKNKEDRNYGINHIWPVDEDGFDYELGWGRISMGAGQNRLVGRTAVFMEAHRIKEKLEKLVTSFFQKGRFEHSELPPQCHVIGSIAGGTGSSMIFDVPYMVKLAAADAPKPVQITGHFAMAGAFQSDLKDPKQKLRTQANTYVALKELDNIYRKFAEAHGEANWKINYLTDFGTVIDPMQPSRVSKQRPMDLVYFYHHENATGYNIESAADIYDVIAQTVSYNLVGGIASKLIADGDNFKNDIGKLNSNRKAKNYSACGVSTLEIPTELLTYYVGYSWAEKLAHMKGNHDYQRAPSDDPKASIWRLMQRKEFEPLQDILLQGCPMWTVDKDTEEWGPHDDPRAVIKQNWERMAEAYGLTAFRPKLNPGIADVMIKDYGSREIQGTQFLKQAEGEVEKHKKAWKTSLKEKIVTIQHNVRSQMYSLSNFSHSEKVEGLDEPLVRSTDAFEYAVGEIQISLGKISEELGYEIDILAGKEAQAAGKATMENLKESKFFGKSGQIQSWTQAAKVRASSRAGRERAILLKQAVDDLSKFLGEEIIKTVKRADQIMTDFAAAAKDKAKDIFGLARIAEDGKAASVYLIKADNFINFANDTMSELQLRAPGIIVDLHSQLKENSGPANLIDALTQGLHLHVLGDSSIDQEKTMDKNSLGFFEKACIDSARKVLTDLNLVDFVKTEFIRKGRVKEFEELLKQMDKKSAPWLTADNAQLSHLDDTLVPVDLLLYPEGAEEIKTVLEKVKGEFRCEVDIKPMPKEVNEGVVRLSYRHGYSLESLKFMEALKNSESAMRESEKGQRKKQRRSILKEYEKFTCPLDDAPREDDVERISLKLSDYYEAASLFIRAHYYGVLELKTKLNKTNWHFKLADTVKGTSEKILPGEYRVALDIPRQETDGLDLDLLKDLYRDSCGEEDNLSMLKIGAILLEAKELKQEIADAEERFRQETGKSDTEVLDDYFHYKINGLSNPKRKKASDTEIRFLKTVIGNDLGLN